MVTARLRAKTAMAAGLLTMFFGAFLVTAPGVAAGDSDIDQYGVQYNGSTYNDGADTTTFSYTWTGPAGQDISHVVVAEFCITPNGYDDEEFEEYDPSTDKTGLKLDGVLTGDTITFVFDGEHGEDPTGATFTLKKQEQKDVITTGPDCVEPDPCDDIGPVGAD